MSELILLVGRPGSGKSTYYQKHFSQTHEYVSQDEQGKNHQKELFENFIDQQKNVVIDRQNHIRDQRDYFLKIAKKNGYQTCIIEFKADKNLCERRILEREGHPTITRTSDVSMIVRAYDTQYQGIMDKEVDEYKVINVPYYAPIQDLTHLTGRIGVFGDPHGVWDEMEFAIKDLKLDHIVFAGDLVDRGPDILKVLDCARKNYSVLGNHDWKFCRSLKGNKITINGGIEKTLEQTASLSEEERNELYTWLFRLPHIIKLPKKHVVVHAGLDPTRELAKQYCDTCLYIRNFGNGKYADPSQPMWYEHPRHEDLKQYTILFGHSIHEKAEVAEGVLSLDKGAVYGTGLRVRVIDTNGVDEIKEYETKNYYTSTEEPERNAKCYKVFVAPYYEVR